MLRELNICLEYPSSEAWGRAQVAVRLDLIEWGVALRSGTAVGAAALFLTDPVRVSLSSSLWLDWFMHK